MITYSSRTVKQRALTAVKATFLGAFLAYSLPSMAVNSLDEPVVVDKRVLLELMVGNFIHGYKEYGTTVYVTDNKLYVEIFYDARSQSKLDALVFKRKVEKEMPYVLQRYDWSKSVAFEVSVFSESEQSYDRQHD